MRRSFGSQNMLKGFEIFVCHQAENKMCQPVSETVQWRQEHAKQMWWFVILRSCLPHVLYMVLYVALFPHLKWSIFSF